MLSRLMIGILAAASSPVAALWLFGTVRGLVPSWSHATVGAGIVVLQGVIGFTGVSLLTIAAARGSLYALRADRRWLRWCEAVWPAALAMLVLWLIVTHNYSGT